MGRGFGIISYYICVYSRYIYVKFGSLDMHQVAIIGDSFVRSCKQFVSVGQENTHIHCNLEDVLITWYGFDVNFSFPNDPPPKKNLFALFVVYSSFATHFIVGITYLLNYLMLHKLWNLVQPCNHIYMFSIHCNCSIFLTTL